MKSTDYYGLKSPGLTCYLNSVLQVLFMTDGFCDAVERFVTSAQISWINGDMRNPVFVLHVCCWIEHSFGLFVVSHLCSSCCSRKTSSFDRHLYQLFADLRKSEAKTHNIIESLGITNGQSGWRDVAPLIHHSVKISNTMLQFLFSLSLWAARRCGVFWEDPVSYESGCNQGTCSYLSFSSDFHILPSKKKSTKIEQTNQASQKGDISSFLRGPANYLDRSPVLAWLFWNSLKISDCGSAALSRRVSTTTSSILNLCSKMFQGELNRTTTCLSCRETTDCRGFFWSLPLEVVDSRGRGTSVVVWFHCTSLETLCLRF